MEQRREDHADAVKKHLYLFIHVESLVLMNECFYYAGKEFSQRLRIVISDS
jgi:hypothetical protein